MGSSDESKICILLHIDSKCDFYFSETATKKIILNGSGQNIANAALISRCNESLLMNIGVFLIIDYAYSSRIVFKSLNSVFQNSFKSSRNFNMHLEDLSILNHKKTKNYVLTQFFQSNGYKESQY